MSAATAPLLLLRLEAAAAEHAGLGWASCALTFRLCSPARGSRSEPPDPCVPGRGEIRLTLRLWKPFAPALAAALPHLM